jgi:hypothetical protein
MNDTSDHPQRYPQDVIPFYYGVLLSTILEIGFRLAGPDRDWKTLHLDHTSHHERALEIASPSSDDEVIADAVSLWTINGDRSALSGSCACYFTKRVERSRPFSPRLRQMDICAIERTWELGVSRLETVRLLNRLDFDVDDMARRYERIELLVNVIRLPAGLESLSPHYWHSLGKLLLTTDYSPELRDMEVMRSLEKAGDWEKLEVWMMVVWRSLSKYSPMQDIERLTLKLLLQRPSASPRFEALCEQGLLRHNKSKLRQVCYRARAERLPSESPQPPYVSVRPTQCLSVLTSLFPLPQSTDSRPPTCSPSFSRGRHFRKSFIVYVMG